MQDLVRSIDAGGLVGLDRQATEKMSARARRFNLDSAARGTEFAYEDYVQLYDSFNVPQEEREIADGGDEDDSAEERSRARRKKRGVFRLQAVTVKGFGPGTDKSDVHDYFKDFNPVSMELVDGNTVNVVWALPSSAAKAMLSLSRPIMERGDEMEVNEVKAKAADSDNSAGEDEDGEMRDDSRKGKENLITKSELLQRVGT